MSPSQFDPYCVTAPANIPGGAQQVCGFFDVNRAAQVLPAHNVFKNDEAFGVDQTEVFDGVDFTMNARFGKGSQVSGGYNIGRTVTDNCFVVNSPQQLYNCRVVVPNAGNSQVKFSGSHTLPYGFAVSAVFQNLPGVPVQANTTFTNDQIAPSLGRNLSGCPAPTGACPGITVALPMLVPNTVFEDRLTQVDFRVLKDFGNAQGRFVRLTFDLYNMFNANTVLARNDTFGLGGGIGWGQPTNILIGRLVKFGGQFSWR